jgi:23S rRNA (pseudouridine1915-N3)-methyltransferase
MIYVFAFGKVKGSVFEEASCEYLKRLQGKVTVSELMLKQDFDNPLLQKQKEGELLLSKIPEGSFLIACDEKGKHLSSESFAEFLGTTLQNNKNIVFLIGGHAGLSQNILSMCHLKLCMGNLTWPHLMARVMLLEQIYRGFQILANHPYHRS